MSWNCYGSTVATLPPLARAALTVLNNARGLYRSRGLTIDEIFNTLRRGQKLTIRFTNARRVQLNDALLLLAEEGKARQTDNDTWKVKR